MSGGYGEVRERELVLRGLNNVKDLTVCPCLHSYFSDNQYPDEAKREEIATACNAVIQKPGM